jgi:hypothetical protein
MHGKKHASKNKMHAQPITMRSGVFTAFAILGPFRE